GESRNQRMEDSASRRRGGGKMGISTEERVELAAAREVVRKHQQHDRVLLHVEGGNCAGYVFAIAQRRVDVAPILESCLDEVRPWLVRGCSPEFLEVRPRLFRRSPFRRG